MKNYKAGFVESDANLPPDMTLSTRLWLSKEQMVTDHARH